jgi:hypothetical protein
VLKNKAIVDEAEKILRDFKPVTYDVSTHIKAIETFETNAVRIMMLTAVPHQIFFNVGENLSDCESEGDGGENRR